MPAELVLLGTVMTVDEARPTAEALAPPEDIAHLIVRATYLAGRRVYADSD
jgi:predicted amidohydrolase YtcJ